ncbi:unnamed protein product [Nippostrongylus brasiliensis]|uniref:Secreted protein n=1 Tax=Nippostrongylus brasiliensis TaxID=27835 RepID=A0A0N4XVX7_NIPBR|nr:unnamed protein product [Nippostrongylus brasiliensis]
MKDLLSLILMSTVALLPREGYSLIIDKTNCSRSNPISYNLTKEQSLRGDLRSLGIELDDQKNMMMYSVSDGTTDIKLFTNTQKYFYVIGSGVTSGTYLCANSITSVEFSQLITECEQPFVLGVNLGDCQISNQVSSSVKDQQAIKAKLSGTNKVDDTVTMTILKSSVNTFSLYFVNSNPPQYLGCKQRSGSCKRPHLISKREHDAYIQGCSNSNGSE